jgi:hypothetical protein
MVSGSLHALCPCDTQTVPRSYLMGTESLISWGRSLSHGDGVFELMGTESLISWGRSLSHGDGVFELMGTESLSSMLSGSLHAL